MLLSYRQNNSSQHRILQSSEQMTIKKRL